MPVLESSNLQHVDQCIQTTAINVEAGIQTSTTYVNTGIQTSARMWYETVRNWITEILSSPKPQVSAQYVDVGVQADTRSTFQIVKDWFRDVCSIRSSELSSLGRNKVAKWREGLDSSSVQSDHTIDTTTTNTTLDRIINPGDSASNISEVASESNLDNVVDNVVNNVVDNVVAPVYNVTNPELYVNILRQRGVEAFSDPDLNQAFLQFQDVVLTVDPNIVNYFI